MVKRSFLLSLTILLLAGGLVFSSDTESAKTAQKPVVGKPAPTITGATLDEKTLQLSELLKKKNKIVLVDFWATWCPPCRGEIPHLQEAYKEFHEQGLEIISINVNEPAKTIEPFIQETPMPWNHIVDADRKLSTLYDVNSIPAPFLIDANGILIAKGSDLRGNSLKKTIEKEIKKLPKQNKEEISLK